MVPESKLLKGQMLPISNVEGEGKHRLFGSRARGVMPGSIPASYGSVPERRALQPPAPEEVP